MKRALYWLWRVLPLPKSLRSVLMWAVNRKFVVGTAVLIRNAQGELLLFKHTYRKDFPWGFPGGYLMRGEDPAGAIQREIREESGFEVRNLRLLEVIQTPEMPRIEVLFEGELAEADVRAFLPSVEVVAARFFPLSDLPALMPEHREILARYGWVKKGSN